MKYLKLYMLFAVAAVFASCSDSDDVKVNSNSATVSMAQTAMTVNEAKDLFTVPVAVTGERNGNVQVTVEVTAAETNGATEDVNYIVTSKTVNISPDQATGEIEIRTVDNEEINENRLFNVTIVDVKGATVGDVKTTAVTLKDNDALFYEKLAGKWKMNSVDDGVPQAWDVTVYTAEEGDPDYEKYFYITGMMGYAWTMATCQYSFDPATKKVSVEMVCGFSDVAPFAEDVNFGLGGYNDVYLTTIVDGKLYTQNLAGELSEDAKTLTFDKSAGLCGAITDKNASFLGYVWFYAYDIVMNKQ